MVTTTNDFEALVIGVPPGLRAIISTELAERGGKASFYSVPQEAILSCRDRVPDLVIVQEESLGIAPEAFIRELLGISWTMSTLLITDEDEETVHEKTEGLGILGHIRSVGDTGSLRDLLDTFIRIRQSPQP